MHRIILPLIAALALPAAPAAAQKAERVLLIFGDDACPKSEDPDEIVVCARRPESERYRIPPRLRGQEIGPAAGNESWAARAEGLEEEARAATGGIGSCSAIGAGGWTGCYQQMLRRYAAERRAAARARRSIDGEE